MKPNKILYRDNLITILELAGEQYTIIDSEDYNKIKHIRWYASPHKRNWYYVIGFRYTPQRETFQLHRMILGVTDSKIPVDHINHNTCDNRKTNIRICTTAQNLWNQKNHKNNQSGYRGVTFQKNRQKWRARISVNGKNIHLGCFSDQHDAANVYQEAARKYYGEFAYQEATR